jgi:hypothetical protein
MENSHWRFFAFFLGKCEDNRPNLIKNRTVSFFIFCNLLLTTRPVAGA